MPNTTQEELENFRKGIELMIRIDSPAVIDNTNADHAKIILEAMFAAVTTSAFVFCGELSPDVWGGENMAQNVQNAIRRGANVKFIVEHPETASAQADMPIMDVLRGHPGVLTTSGPIQGWNRHFAVFDSKRFRVETNHDAKTALACANDSKLAKGLEFVAETMLKTAKPVA